MIIYVIMKGKLLRFRGDVTLECFYLLSLNNGMTVTDKLVHVGGYFSSIRPTQRYIYAGLTVTLIRIATFETLGVGNA